MTRLSGDEFDEKFVEQEAALDGEKFHDFLLESDFWMISNWFLWKRWKNTHNNPVTHLVG